MVHLEELYISHNAIERIQGLENVVNLKILDVSNNRITELCGLDHLHNLEEFWVIVVYWILLII